MQRLKKLQRVSSEGRAQKLKGNNDSNYFQPSYYNFNAPQIHFNSDHELDKLHRECFKGFDLQNIEEVMNLKVERSTFSKNWRRFTWGETRIL